MDVKGIIKEYYKQLYAPKFDNLDQTNHSFEIRKLHKFTQREIDDQNRYMSSKETQPIVTIVPPSQNKTQQAQMVSLVKHEILVHLFKKINIYIYLYQIFKEEMIPILHNLFQKIDAEEILCNSLYMVSITLIPKPDNNIRRKENKRLSLMRVDTKIINLTLYSV